MLTWYVRIVAAVLFLAGIFGFALTRIPNVVQLDLLQSFTYLLIGAVGLQLGFSSASAKTQARYTQITGIVGFLLLAVGLTFPNLFDIVHLEVPEHLFHAVLGLTGSLVGEHYLSRH